MGVTISSPYPQTPHQNSLPLYPNKNLTLIPTCDHDLQHSPHNYDITPQTQIQQMQQQRRSNSFSPPRYRPSAPSRGGSGRGGGPNARYKYVGPGMYWDTWHAPPPPAYQERGRGVVGLGDVVCGLCGRGGEEGCAHMNGGQQQQQFLLGAGNGTANAFHGHMGGGGGVGCGPTCSANDGGIRVKGNWGDEDVDLKVGGRERCPCDAGGGCETNQRKARSRSRSRRRAKRREKEKKESRRRDRSYDSESSGEERRGGGRGGRERERERERMRAEEEERWRRPFRDVGERLGWTAADMAHINTGAENLNKSTAPRPPMEMGGGPMDGMGMGPMGPMGGMNPMGMGAMPGMGATPMSRLRRPRRPRMRPEGYGGDQEFGLDEGIDRLGGLGDTRSFGAPDDFEGAGPGFGMGLDDEGFGGGFGRGRRPPGGRLGKRPKGKGLGGRPPRRGREAPDFEDYCPPEMSGALGRGNDDDGWEEG